VVDHWDAWTGHPPGKPDPTIDYMVKVNIIQATEDVTISNIEKDADDFIFDILLSLYPELPKVYFDSPANLIFIFDKDG
jgi:hypothetical protein